MTRLGGPRTLFLAAAALALGVVGVALYTQHALGMLPCPWCVLQRLIFVVAGAVALLGAALSGPGSGLGGGLARRRVFAAMLLLGATAGMAAALWQHFVAASNTSCKLTLADRIMSASGLDAWLPDVFAAWATCADAAVKLLGLPYEAWSLAAFVLLGAAAVRLLRLPAQR